MFDWCSSTIAHLLEFSRTLSEGAGCLGLAALMYGKIKVRPNEKVCVVVCGGNIDMSTLRQVFFLVFTLAHAHNYARAPIEHKSTHTFN